MSARPVSTIIREFITESIEGADTIVLTDLQAAAVVNFTGDAEYAEALLRDATGLLVADQLRSLMRTNRHLIPTENGATTSERLNLRAKQIAALIYESTGDGTRKALIAMNRTELRFARQQREAMADSILQFATFERALEERLPNDSTTVGEFFSDAEFAALWRDHFDAGPPAR